MTLFSYFQCNIYIPFLLRVIEDLYRVREMFVYFANSRLGNPIAFSLFSHRENRFMQIIYSNGDRDEYLPVIKAK